MAEGKPGIVMPVLAGPCRDLRFGILWNGRCAAGFAEVSPLPVDLKVAPRRESGGPPPAIGPEGQGTPYFINFDQGIATDRGFTQWISMVRCYGPATGKGSLLPEYKRPLAIEVHDGNGELLCTYHLENCWVTEYRAVPDPAGSSAMVIEHLRLGFVSWTKDPPSCG
jgi:phage tail-like protein